MDKIIVVDLAFTNKGNRQTMIRSIRSFIGNDNVGYLYLDQSSNHPTPIVIKPKEIESIKLTAKIDAANAYEFIGPNYKGDLPGMVHLKGRQREVPIGIRVDSMDYRGHNKTRNIKVTSVMIADNNIFMVKSIQDNVIKIELY